MPNKEILLNDSEEQEAFDMFACLAKSDWLADADAEAAWHQSCREAMKILKELREKDSVS